jgi:3-hydroxyisobutyrate dehydrogenase
MKKVAFIGLGNMGLPMAINLVKAGFDVSGFDLVQESLNTFASEGGRAVTDPKNAYADAEVVITMLPSGKAVEAVYTRDGVFEHTPKGALLIDCSTIENTAAVAVAQAATEAGFSMLDAPVSGGTAGAAAGTLTFIVGGEAEALESARPLLEAMGKNIFHAGASGAGQVAKMCNNMLLAIHMIGTSEALNLGVANGLDAQVLSDIMAKSSGRNWSLDTYNPHPGVMAGVPASREYAGGFGVDLMCKDLGIAMSSANQSRTATPLGSLSQNLYNMHSHNGSGGLDFSSIIQFLKKQEP